ncbi:MAG: MFS transporter [Candidatus Thorarchaeota archaeon]|jgi:GPH family glycoside/pentoside/hexuronide:cation symporter
MTNMEDNLDKDLAVDFDERLPFRSKLAFGFSQGSINLLQVIALGSAITFYYNVKLGLSEEWISLAWLLFAFWNAINDPLFGILQERIDTDIGRRIPVLRYGAPFYTITFLICWFPFLGSSQIALFWNLLLVLFLFDTMFTMVGLVITALPAEMCITQEARSNLSLYNVILGSTGGLLGMVLPLILLTDETTTELNPLFKPVMIVLAIFAGVVLFSSSHALTENEYARTEDTLDFIESMIQTVKNREFLVFESMNFFREMAFTIVTGSLIYFVQYVLNLQGILASIPLFVMFVLMLVFSFLADRMVKKQGLKRVYIIGLLLTSTGLFLLLFSGIWMIAVTLSLVVIGIGLAPGLLIWSPLLADVMDYDEILTGKRRETTYAGMNALISKPAISVANALFLLIISRFGFDNTLSVQPSSAIFGIQLAYTLIPAISFVIGAIVMWKWYTLDGKEWIAKKTELAKIHLQKEKEYIDHLRSEGRISKVYQKLYGEPKEET